MLRALLVTMGLVLLSQASLSEEIHHHHDAMIVQIAQNQFYIATCSQNDFSKRCSSLAEARAAADAHAKATGHKTGVVKE